jgi:hypothetical protein
MPAKKIRVELFDGEGNRYTIAFEGHITRDKAVRLLDLVELLGGVQPQQPTGTHIQDIAPQSPSPLSKFDKVNLIARQSLPLVWFSSREVQVAYEQEYKEPIGLSTVATYLSRLADRGALSKAGPTNSLRYKLLPQVASALLPEKKV